MTDEKVWTVYYAVHTEHGRDVRRTRVNPKRATFDGVRAELQGVDIVCVLHGEEPEEERKRQQYRRAA